MSYIRFYFLSLALRYTASIEEKRFNPRAVFDHPDRQQPQNLTLFPGQETCDHIYFHVMVSSHSSQHHEMHFVLDLIMVEVLDIW